MDTLREWTARLFSPQSLWIALWVGLGVFTVVLVLLINTRLGKSQPLRKCAILAIWFHLLLLIYATSIPIVAQRPGGGNQVTINLGMGDTGTQANHGRGEISRHQASRKEAHAGSRRGGAAEVGGAASAHYVGVAGIHGSGTSGEIASGRAAS